MKKIIMLICVLLLFGCSNTIKPVEEETKYLTKDEMSETLYNYGVEIYNQKKYVSIEKTEGEYFISLNDLSNLNYDISKFVNPNGNHESCDKEKTGVVIDLDNVRKVEYEKYPLMVSVFCD